MTSAFFVHVYLLVAFMATGSWGMYVGLVALSAFTDREYIELRVTITLFGIASYGVLSLMSFNVAVPDGSGGTIVGSYASLAAMGLLGAMGMGLFFFDSVMKAMAREAPTGDMDKGVEL